MNSNFPVAPADARIRRSRPRSIARRLVLPATLAVGLSLAVAGPATAQTRFQASVAGVTPKPRQCPSGENLCGAATTNYGPATWSLAVVNDSLISSACAAYEANVTFVLGDGSTLALDEKGTLCQPGNALSAPGSALSYGNPFSFDAAWTVQSADGQFASISGTGTDTLHAAGARVTGTYSQAG